ncbi:CCR4-NOT transcription complex subunit 1-like [Lemur catta]|uniref:CCR4-NOT transcription complex subunit 1-like n=1 Tax=Lemur catta TaxID=9447 RepID=UPI001E268B4A|nr:CCR4-NOT transcription complex subunit 1-like [Lemur catta]
MAIRQEEDYSNQHKATAAAVASMVRSGSRPSKGKQIAAKTKNPFQKNGVTLRVLLVLLHDFPEFLCDYHYGFCDVIPPNCIQLRNLILSALPRNMRLPDPFTPNLKADMLSEINITPWILTNFTGVMPPQFKKDLDSYLKTRLPVTFLSDLHSNLQVSSEPGNRYNLQLINALVLYVGTQAIAHIHNKGSTPSVSPITHSAHMDIFQNLAVDLDTEGRYLFLNAIANHPQYPNGHTHYFSCTILHLFAEANTEAIQEQITRVLLEQLIVNRPHLWGLLITFIELIKNTACVENQKTFKAALKEFLLTYSPQPGVAEDQDSVLTVRVEELQFQSKAKSCQIFSGSVLVVQCVLSWLPNRWAHLLQIL